MPALIGDAGPTADSSEFDVFVSVAGPDKPVMRTVVESLSRAGLRVFLDERDIERFTGITTRIRRALAGTKAVLICYSRAYPTRSACQWELTAAFHAASTLGDPARRLLVINPESTEEHIAPVELADARFSTWPGSRGEVRHLTEEIVARVAELDGPLGQPGTVSPRWLPDGMREQPRFVGRYRDLWALHTRLRAVDHPLTAGTGAGVVVLAGMSGIGKTTLVTEYARQFGAFYPGGVYWTDVSGDGTEDAADVPAWYEDQIRRLLIQVGYRIEGMPAHRLAPLMGEYLDSRSGPSLWVVDGVPAGLGAEVIRRLVLPSTSVRTVLVTQDGGYGDVAAKVELGPMEEEDATALLAIEQDSPEATATRRLAEALGRHPFALAAAARSIRHLEDLITVEDLLRRLRSGPPGSTGVGTILDGTIERLDAQAVRLLELAAVVGPAAVPTALFEAVVGAEEPAGVDRIKERVGGGLAALRRFLLATRTATGWTVHPLVVDAVRRRTQARPADLAPAAARAVLALLAERREEDDHGVLLAHAHALAYRDGVPGNLRPPLLRVVGEHRLRSGDALAAARIYSRIDDLGAAGAEDLLAGARARNASGDHEGALDCAKRALELVSGGAAQQRVRQTMAQALDGMGRYQEADEHWRAADPGSRQGGGPSVDGLAFRVARVRALRLRGAARGAIALCDETLRMWPEEPETADARQELFLELARLQLVSGEEKRARRTAERVVEHYRSLALPEHAVALAAQEVAAYSTVSLQLWELRPNTRGWGDAEHRLAQLHCDYAESLGPHNTLTLTTAVHHGLTVLRLGRPTEACRLMTETEQHCRIHLGHRHPTTLTAVYVLGLARFQLSEFPVARELLRSAFERRLSLLGPVHVDTLDAKLALATTLLLLGDRGRAQRMIEEVRRDLPKEVGRGNDLYGRALLADLLLPRMPGWLLRAGIAAARFGGNRP